MIFEVKSVEQAFDVTIDISDEQRAQEDEWRAAVNGELQHNLQGIPSLYRAALLSSRVAKIVTLEEEITISGSPVAGFINEQFVRFRKNLSNGFRAGVERCCNGGRVLAFLEQLNDRIDIVIYENNEYFPVERDRQGNLIDVIITYTITREDDGHYYALAGRYIYDEQAQQMTVIYKAFRSSDEEKLGREIDLTDVEEWKDLQSEVIYNYQEESWFFEINMPKGEALFAKAIDLFRKLDEHKYEEEMEFLRARSRIFIPIDYLKFDERNGGHLKDDNTGVFQSQDTDDTVTIFNPTIRNQNFAEQSNQIERDIEKACEIAYGTISDPAQQARTATEVLSSKDVTFTTIQDIQEIWETTFRKMAVAMRSIAVTFLGYGYGELEFVFDWNDGVPVDEKEELEMTKGVSGMLQLNQDIISPQERRAYLFKRLPDLASLTEDELTAAVEGLPGLPEMK